MKKLNIKKISYLGLSVFLLATGCSMGVEKKENQTTFKVNEEAFIDQYQIKCSNYTVNGNELKVHYTVTNNSNQSTEIDLSDDFKLYGDDGNLYDSLSTGTVHLEHSETKDIEVTFTVNDTIDSDHSYMIIFYSGVVSNNIGFVLE